MMYSEEDRKIINIIRPVVGDYTLDALHVAKKVFDALKENGYEIRNSTQSPRRPRCHVCGGIVYWSNMACSQCGTINILPDENEQEPREYKSFFESLTPEQKEKALNYQGLENHGDPAFKLKN